jgi:hypothetical protein
MKIVRRLLLSAAMTAAAIGGITSGAAPVAASVPAGYTLRVLQPLPNSVNAYGLSINARGTIVGFSDDPLTRAVTWAPNSSTAVSLGTPAGTDGSEAFAINDYGTPVGEATTGGAHYAAQFGGASATRIGTLPSSATTIGNDGFAYGTVEDPSILPGAYRPAKFANGGFTYLAPDLGDATAVNDHGDVVGDAAGQAVRFVNGVAVALAPPAAEQSFASDINNNGIAVGFQVDATLEESAVSFANGVATPLAGPRSAARSINDGNQAVGFATFGDQRGAALFENGQAIDLNAIIPNHTDVHLVDSYGINNSGVIVGWASFCANDICGNRGFVLTPPVTTITADPPIARLSLAPKFLGGVTAHLTSAGAPLVGVPVVFTLPNGSLICQSTTDATGTASCVGTAGVGVLTSAARSGYVATYAGDNHHQPASAAAPGVGIYLRLRP